MNDHWHMKTALGLARRALGRVWPNPAVGCVIVQGDADIVGRGHTAPGGRPHAETQALQQAGAAAKGACAYVTLEPCAHDGQTPPCADALIAAGIARVVIASQDPDLRVNGAGIARLQAAGIAVSVGLMDAEAVSINAGFMSRVTQNRPLFTLKSATSLDGRIATGSGESQWITGDLTRARGHLLRAQHDAILVGAETARRDNPLLTCRLPGLTDRSPVRIVLDTAAQLDPALALFNDEQVPTWLVVGDDVPEQATNRYTERGVRVIKTPMQEGVIDLLALAGILASEGLTRVLIEGGSRVAASFLAAGLVDRLVWFRAGSIIGGDGLAAIGDLGVQALSSSPRFKRIKSMTLGDDFMECFEA